MIELSSKKPPTDLRRQRRLLVIKPSSLGDLVHTLPSVHDLKTSFPHLEITWLANTEWLPLLQGHPEIDALEEFPRRQFRGVEGLARGFFWMLTFPRRCSPDTSLDFQGLFRSGLISWFTGAPHRLGLSDAREGSRFFYTDTVGVDAQSHAVDRYRTLVGALGADISRPATFTLPPGIAVEAALPSSPFVALHPFSRGEGKSLSLEQVNAFCRMAEVPVVLLGRIEPEQRALLDLPDRCLDLLNETSIPQLIHCLRAAAAVVSVDSGPMHLAAAIQPARVLGIHTWSDPRKVGPYPAESWVWKGGEIHQRGRLPEAVCLRAQFFEDGDVEAIADWARHAISA